MSAEVLEGRIEVNDIGNGGSEVCLDGESIAAFAERIKRQGGGRSVRVKAVLMIEDKKCVDAQGMLDAWEGDSGYSSWTPGGGPSVSVWDPEAKDAVGDIAGALAENPGCNAALSLEVI